MERLVSYPWETYSRSKASGKFCNKAYLRGSGRITKDRGQFFCRFPTGIGSKELVHRIRMIFTGLSLTNALILQSGQGLAGRQSAVESFRYSSRERIDLTFRNISRKVRDWMGLIIFRHGQDWDHRNGALLAADLPCPFVHGGKVRIKVAR